MSDEIVRLSAVGQLLRGRWRVLAACAVLGAVIGAGASVWLSPGYEASASVLLQGGTAEDDMVSAPEVATSSVVLDRAADSLGGQVSVAELRDSVTADAGTGTVVVVTGEADTPRQAQLLANRVAQQYAAFANQLANRAGSGAGQQGADLRQQVAQADDRIADLLAAVSRGGTPQGNQLGTQIEGLRSSLDQARSKLEDTGSTENPTSVTVIGPAQLPSAPASPTLPECILAGAAAGLLIGIFGHLVTARMDRRLRHESDIAAALGAPLLGSVDVPEGDHLDGGTRPAGRARRLRRLLLGSRPWNLPRVPVAADGPTQQVRYRRVLSRLRGGSAFSLRVLVLAPDDDPAARHAVGGLTDAAAADAATRQTTVDVIEVRSDRPTVPECGQASAVVAVVTAGTRTPWELMSLTEACADAGYRLDGVVVAYRARPYVRDQGGRPAARAAERAVNGKVRVSSS